MRIAVDIGGTFTDLVAVDDDGRVSRSKALTTPDDLARGIGDCLTGANVAVAGANFFVHGSTVTINAVLERKGARTGLITTKGFRDVYEIGRGNRPEGYNLFFKRPVPLVPRDLRLEVDERLYASGEVLTRARRNFGGDGDRRVKKSRRRKRRGVFAPFLCQCGP